MSAYHLRSVLQGCFLSIDIQRQIRGLDEEGEKKTCKSWVLRLVEVFKDRGKGNVPALSQEEMTEAEERVRSSEIASPDVVRKVVRIYDRKNGDSSQSDAFSPVSEVELREEKGRDGLIALSLLATCVIPEVAYGLDRMLLLEEDTTTNFNSMKELRFCFLSQMAIIETSFEQDDLVERARLALRKVVYERELLVVTKPSYLRLLYLCVSTLDALNRLLVGR